MNYNLHIITLISVAVYLMNQSFKQKQRKKRLTRYGPALVLALLSGPSFAQHSDALTISGFGRITAGYLDTDQANFKGYSDSVTAKPESLVGLQASYEFTPAVSLTVQGILHADDSENDSVINWAYLTWQPDDNLVAKFGRLRTPFFALSDVVDVGYSYPWITAPQQVYNAYLFPTFDGVDLSWGYPIGDLDTSLEGYIGRYDGEINLNNQSTDYTVDVFGGVVAKAHYNNFELRASTHHGKVDIGLDDLDTLKSGLELAGYADSADAISRQGWVDVHQLSINYDNLEYFARGEWVSINPDISIAPEIESYYLTGGYNFFPFTVHLTYAQSLVNYPTFPDEIPYTYGTVPQIDQLYYAWQGLMSRLSNDSLRSWTLGARWDVVPKVALKAEVTLLDGDSDKNSFFDSIQTGFDRDASLYKISVEWMF